MNSLNTSENTSLISQFVEQDVLQAFNVISSEENTVPDVNIISTIANSFCAGNSIDSFVDMIVTQKTDVELKLVTSFHKNLKLLVEKTWVEPADATVKEQVLYRIDELCKQLTESDYSGCYEDFINVLTDVVYLMFGTQAKSADFHEYALRIDPEFGIFWWYVQSLPKKKRWSNDKSRVAVLLGMFFLANY
ncbi:MAG: hypothetical protein J6B32_03050 [Spirochaetaceae bacterium]|nr:hypothetical protein [Spirochaetaceae bacterium]